MLEVVWRNRGYWVMVVVVVVAAEWWWNGRGGKRGALREMREGLIQLKFNCVRSQFA